MHEVPASKIRNFSAAFVSASALGMTVGPAMASLLHYVNFEVFTYDTYSEGRKSYRILFLIELRNTFSYFGMQVFGIVVNYCTAPGWVVGFGWSFYLLLVLIFFKEPTKRSSKEADLTNSSGIISNPNEKKSGSSDSLLSYDKEQAMVDKTKTINQNSGSLMSVLKDMNLPIQILLANYFMLKFASEMLVSESTLVSGYYFSWSSSLVRE